MKKLISALTAMASIASLSAFNTFAEDKNPASLKDYMVYDMNQDGNIDNLDIQALCAYFGRKNVYKMTFDKNGNVEKTEKYAAENSAEVNDYISKHGDVTSDGLINNNDANALLYNLVRDDIFSQDLNNNGEVDYTDVGIAESCFDKIDKINDEPYSNMKMLFREKGTKTPNDNIFYISYAFDKFETGDVTADGIVDAVDASVIVSYYFYKQTTGKYEGGANINDITSYGDYNNDGSIDAVDASLILKYYSDTQTNAHISPILFN